MEEMNLNEELERVETVETEGTGEESYTDSHEVNHYDDYEPRHEIGNIDDEDDDEDGNLGYLIAAGLVAGGAVLGAWAWPKVKKGVSKAKDWVKSKVNKDQPDEVVDAEVVESK